MTKSKKDHKHTEIISRFAIKDLNGDISINCIFKDNRLILVGENGYGKTTILSLLYYTLTKQWNKLRRYNFSEIILVIAGKNLSFFKNELENFTEEVRFKNEIDAYVIMNGLEDTIEVISPNFYRDISHSINIPLLYVRRYFEALNSIKLSENVIEIDRFIDQELDFQILYLPTYRRIEQDIRRIFPEIAKFFTNSPERRGESSKNYVEFVEFGMSDVDLLVNNELDRLREEFRGSLLDLTNNFLSGILTKNYVAETEQEIDPDLYEMLKSRYSKELERTLNISGFEKIIGDINRKKAKSDHDKIVQYFWQQLFTVYVEQFLQSANMLGFSRVVDSYLARKDVIFNSQDYTFSIHRNAKKVDERESHDKIGYSLAFSTDKYNNSSPIRLRDLSSGEKQIVSLFAHLYLGKFSHAFVIIDEPELSLSIDWQRKFLVDIMKSPKVFGLFSVTHSPFIFDNDLEIYTHDIAEFSGEF